MNKDDLGRKYTLWSILKEYDRIEIPIIQRDYAQGRRSAIKVRNDILDYILKALSDRKSIELDFVYGVVHSYIRGEKEQKAFIPIDGQQRLTTLWLLHWYLFHQVGLLDGHNSEELSILEKFTYETRPSSKDFLECLCSESIAKDVDIREEIIENSAWFDESWKLDPSIMGFITMLESIANHPIIGNLDIEGKKNFLHDLINNEVVTFYFLELEHFGLGEEIYTRMNARGKVLTDFEKFKSNFFKIIDKSPLRKEISNKIEYEWVSNLWSYRSTGVYVTDIPFMNWLKYITQMLYVQQMEKNSAKSSVDFLSNEILELVYSSDENLKFLIHSFDAIPRLISNSLTFSLEWNSDKGLSEAVKWLLKDFSSTDVMKQIGVYAALLFIQRYESMEGIDDFLRVVRNLLQNTPDRSLREWPRMIESIKLLIVPDVYKRLREKSITLKGFRTEQVEVEKFKANMISLDQKALDLIREMDAHPALKGRLGTLIIELLEPKATENFTLKLANISPADVNLLKLSNLYKGYVSLYTYNSKNSNDHDFNKFWGNLLPSKLYTSNENVCWWNDGNDTYVTYEIHPVIMKWARKVAMNNRSLDETVEQYQKNYVKTILKKYDYDIESVTSPKEQLYLLYIISTRILDMSWTEFFKCGRWNFGWVNAETGFTTPFNTNRIYQAYPERFRSDSGIVPYRTPEIHLAYIRGNNIFQRLVDWASE